MASQSPSDSFKLYRYFPDDFVFPPKSLIRKWDKLHRRFLKVEKLYPKVCTASDFRSAETQNKRMITIRILGKEREVNWLRGKKRRIFMKRYNDYKSASKEQFKWFCKQYN